MPTVYEVQTPTTTVTVQSPTTTVEVAALGTPGRTGAPSPITYYRAGPALPLTGKARWRFPFNATLIGVSAAVSAAPQGDGIEFDVLVNGVVAGTFTLPDGSEELAEQTISVPISVGDYVTVNITAVGSTYNGDDLTVFVRYTT